MIKSFRCRNTEKLFNRVASRKIPASIYRVALRKLWMIDAAMAINDLRIPPANHLEALRGKRRGQYSVRINIQWRICFKWRSGDAYEVEIVDYH